MLAALLVVASVAFAQDEPTEFAWSLPEAPAPVALECGAAVDLVVGRPPPDGLLDEEGNVACYATAVPTSDLAGLLLVDAWATRAVTRGARGEMELSWERERYERLSEAFDKPTPWIQRPGVQRNLGRVETLAVFVLGVATVAILDSQVIQ